MPRKLTSQDIDSGLAVVLKKAEPPPPVNIDVVDVLKEITAAISKLVALHTMTKALIEKPIIQPDHSEILDRMAEIQLLTQQTMENIGNSISDTIRGVGNTPIPASKTRSIEMTVTERDAWGRIKSIKANLEG